MTPVEFLQQYYWIIIVAYAAGFIGILAYFLTKNRGKILVRIKRPGMSELEVWKKPEVHGQQTTINMQEETKKKSGWSFTFDTDCLVAKKGFLKSYFAVDVKPDAPRACKWSGSLPDAEQPALTKAEVTQYAKTKVFKIRYDTKEQGPTNMTMVIIGVLVVGSLIVGVLNFLQTRGIKI